MAHETLEQTQRRLGLGPASSTSSRPTRPRQPFRGRGLARILLVLGIIIGVGVIGFNVALNDWGAPAAQWSAYPATAFTDGEDILEAGSLEQARAEADDLTREIQSELGAYGFEWTKLANASTSLEPNGYGGDSMLYRLDGAVYVGQVLNTRVSARETVVDSFGRVVERHGLDWSIANDLFDGAQVEPLYGSSDRDAQALWSAQSSEDDHASLTALIQVFDSEVPTGGTFTPPRWLPDEPTGTLFVRVTVTARDRLPEGDRAAFIEALAPFEGRAKPEYHG